MKTYLLILFLAFFAFSCNNSSSAEQEQENKTEVAQLKYTLTPFSSSTQFPDAKIESWEFKEGKFSFGIGGQKYKLGVQTPDAGQKMCANSQKGQHIHLIVDDKPYAAKYEAEFDYEIADGQHYLLAFLSRSYHESIKTADAHVVVQANIENNSITESKPVDAPMLFYSRPKGTYVGKADTEKVMLDFYLANLDLGAAYSVKAEINGEEHRLDKWQPYYIEGLEMGENTIKLTLLDKDGKAVDTPLNPVSRTFTLKADPVEE